MVGIQMGEEELGSLVGGIAVVAGVAPGVEASVGCNGARLGLG